MSDIETYWTYPLSYFLPVHNNSSRFSGDQKKAIFFTIIHADPSFKPQGKVIPNGLYPTFLENCNGDRAYKVVGRYNAIVTPWILPLQLIFLKT